MERLLPLTPTHQNILEIVTPSTFTQQNVLFFFKLFFIFFLTPVFLLFRKPLQENYLVYKTEHPRGHSEPAPNGASSTGCLLLLHCG
jgi:hypothetical protein